jgi:hypothetical protein
MPPRRFSRHTFTEAYEDDNGRLMLTEPEPFRYQSFPDNRIHTVKGGETIFSIAAKYFRPLPRPSGFFWILMDFQPVPIIDPTLKLAEGSKLVVPSLRTVLEEVFSEKRRGL